MAENNFNKFGVKAHGTLIGNWQEERELKDFTGTSRTIPKQHIPKKHLDFEGTITNNFKADITQQRIHGEKVDADMHSEAWTVGKGKNKADLLPKVGLRTLTLEKDIQAAVMRELQEKEQEQKRIDEVYSYILKKLLTRGFGIINNLDEIF